VLKCRAQQLSVELNRAKCGGWMHIVQREREREVTGLRPSRRPPSLRGVRTCGSPRPEPAVGCSRDHDDIVPALLLMAPTHPGNARPSRWWRPACPCLRSHCTELLADCADITMVTAIRAGKWSQPGSEALEIQFIYRVVKC
jgi:hypothetical protein